MCTCHRIPNNSLANFVLIPGSPFYLEVSTVGFVTSPYPLSGYSCRSYRRNYIQIDNVYVRVYKQFMILTDSHDADLIGIQSRLLKRISELEDEMRPLQEQTVRLKTQLELVERALQVGSPTERSVNSHQGAQTAKASVSDRVFDLLKDAGKSLHVSDILSQYVAKGFAVPGQGKESNLLVYIVRDPRFIRVSKGTYALAQGELQPTVATVKVKRRRRKKAKGKSNG